MAEWVVNLSISGPITIRSLMTLDVEKGYNQPFWTTVRLKRISAGVRVEVVARANSQEAANDTAVFFVGQMLDVLCLWTDLPLLVSVAGEQVRSSDSHVQRIVEEAEWIRAFGQGRQYGMQRQVYSRALSWYRKGVTSEDPIDKFLAFWSALEGFGSESARRNDRTRLGSINQICDCFDQLWGDVSNWKIIPNHAQWVNRFHDTRNGIAHGFIPVNIDTLRDISEHLPTLRQLAHAFLTDWENRGPQAYE